MKSETKIDFLSDVSKYYSRKLQTHGESPAGVDWNSEESQILRFTQLCEIINNKNPFSINDLGCGYGAFYEFLSKHYKTFAYHGIDISNDMISAAKQRFVSNTNHSFTTSDQPEKIAGYGIASGIFNVRLNKSDEEWLSYLHATLDMLDQTSSFGFAFNCLTSYSDTDKMQDYLYYADPCALFDYCKKHYSKNIALLHDYGLYEFTILVRKQL